MEVEVGAQGCSAIYAARGNAAAATFPHLLLRLFLLNGMDKHNCLHKLYWAVVIFLLWKGGEGE